MVHMQPRRRPPAGGYARGDEKRLHIIDVALRIFGDNGYERASTRQIALEAGVSPPALQYYFDGKEGLYRACAKHIAERILQALEVTYEAAAAISDDDPEAAADALHRIMDTLADLVFSSEHGEGWSRFIARSQTEGTGPADDAFKQRISTTLQSNCARLVALATGYPVEDTTTKLRTLAILGQLTIFYIGRDMALASLGWMDFGGERMVLLKRVIREQTRAILKGFAVGKP